MLFKQLALVARHTPIHLAITPQDGDRLKVIVTPLPTGKAKDYEGLSKQFSAVGTPEELDAEFIPALNTYAGKVNDVRAEIGLPLDQLDKDRERADKKAVKQREKEEAEATEKRRKEKATKKAAETRAANAAKKKEEDERKAREREEKKLAKKAAKGGAGIVPPGAPAAAWPFPTGAKVDDAATPATNGKPGKPECIADYKTTKEKHGDKLTRRLFVKKSKTGRRYERLWTNWEEFVAAVAQGELPLAATDISSEAAPAAGTAVDQGDRPGPKSTAPAAAPAEDLKPAADPKPHKVYAPDEFEPIAESNHPYQDGERLEIPGRVYPYRIFEHSPAGDQLVTYRARPVLQTPKRIFDIDGKDHGATEEIYIKASRLADTKGLELHEVVEVTVEMYVVKNPLQKRWTVFSLEGKEISSLPAEPKVGDQVTIHFTPISTAPMRVVDVDGTDVTVAPIRPKVRAEQPSDTATTE